VIGQNDGHGRGTKGLHSGIGSIKAELESLDRETGVWLHQRNPHNVAEAALLPVGHFQQFSEALELAFKQASLG
jgi:hypothetical protein